MANQAKEAPSPYEIRLTPLDTNPVFQCLGDNLVYSCLYWHIDWSQEVTQWEERLLSKVLGLTFSSKLDCDSYMISIAKTASKKIRDLILSMKFLSPEVALYLYKSTIQPCMEYYCHAWVGVPYCYMESDLQDCCALPFCFSWTLGSLLNCSQLKSFL